MTDTNELAKAIANEVGMCLALAEDADTLGNIIETMVLKHLHTLTQQHALVAQEQAGWLERRCQALAAYDASKETGQ